MNGATFMVNVNQTPIKQRLVEVLRDGPKKSSHIAKILEHPDKKHRGGAIEGILCKMPNVHKDEETSLWFLDETIKVKPMVETVRFRGMALLNLPTRNFIGGHHILAGR